DAHSGGATHYPNAAGRLAHAFASLVDGKGCVQIEGFYDDVRQPTDADRAMLERMPFDARATRAVVGIEAFAFGRTDDEAKWASVFEPTCNVCGIESGYNGPGSKTVIPAEATGKIDFRLVPDQDPMKIAALLRAHLDRHGFGDVEFSAEEGEHRTAARPTPRSSAPSPPWRRRHSERRRCSSRRAAVHRRCGSSATRGGWRT